MGKPTEEELELALNAAAKLRELGEDKYFLGKSLLNLHYRLQAHERALEAIKHYLHSGHGAREHTDLLKAIERVEEASSDRQDDEDIHPW